MRMLNRGIALLTVLALTGVATAASPYQGSYTGTFSVKGISADVPDQDGKLAIKMSEDGKITGTVDNRQLKQQGKVTGTITDDGEIAVTIQYPDQDASTVSGSVTSPKDGRIKGTLTQDLGKNGTVVVKIELKKGD